MGFNNDSWCTLNNYLGADGKKKLARYRWNYLSRAVNGSANNYTNVFALIDAANAFDPARLEAEADMEQWMRTFAVEHAVGNWDAFGCQNAQNMYGYKPLNGKWTLFIWDYNIVLGNCHAGPDNPQVIEVTRDKKVVWTFKDMTNFGNATTNSQLLDVNPSVR